MPSALHPHLALRDPSLTGPAASLHQPDPIMIFVVELAYACRRQCTPTSVRQTKALITRPKTAKVPKAAL
jgi:hypothetical protein